MSTEVKMPQMGESIAEGTLTRWFKKPGEAVVRDEPLFEISTDKVDAEVPAPSDGVLEKILVEEGATVEVNTTVAMLGSGNGAAAAATPEAKEAVEGKAAAAPSSPPPPSSPAANPPAPVTTAPAPAATASSSSDTSKSKAGASKVRSSPLVRRIAREHGIEDLSVIPGTGAGGRVTKHDILGYIDQKNGAAPVSAPAAATAPTTAAAGAGHVEVLPVLGLPRENASVERMTVMRKKIAEHMVHSRRTSAHVHSVFEADMTRVVKIRQRSKAAFMEKNGLKLTVTPFFMKACIDALREFPWVNASLDGDEIVAHNSVHFGIAVALDGGLIVPVIKNAQDLNVTGIQKRVTDLATRARSKQLVPDEVAGGTFTITNPGQFGGLFGIPIISQPQVAILGVGGIQRRPVVVEGDAIAVRDMAYLCLGYDHRLVDGAMADQFMARIKQNLENFDDAEFR